VAPTRDDVPAETGKPIARACFPRSGIVSLVVGLDEGGVVEAAMIGRESLFGAASVVAGGVSPNNAIVRLPGMATMIEIDRLRALADRSPA